MSAAARNRDLANELARRAIAAAERRRAVEVAGDDVAERLRAAADDDGTLTVDRAVEALGGDDPAPINPLASQLRAKWSRTTEGLTRRYEPESTPSTAEGDVGAGKGDGGKPPRLERVGDEDMEVLDLDQVMNNPDQRS